MTCYPYLLDNVRVSQNLDPDPPNPTRMNSLRFIACFECCTPCARSSLCVEMCVLADDKTAGRRFRQQEASCCYYLQRTSYVANRLMSSLLQLNFGRGLRETATRAETRTTYWYHVTTSEASIMHTDGRTMCAAVNTF